MNENDCLNNGILNLMQKRVAKNRGSKQERVPGSGARSALMKARVE